jgi:D-sedoheptulose 7-phosphate isomerase
VCDLLGTCLSVGMSNARVIGLSDNAAVLTALANDIGFAEVFSRQIQMRARPGDLLLMLSVSGESDNLERAAQTAQRRGMRVVAAVGNAGRIVRYCDPWVEFGNGDYGLTEDLHVALNHIVVRMLNGGEARRYRGVPLPMGARAERLGREL